MKCGKKAVPRLYLLPFTFLQNPSSIVGVYFHYVQVFPSKREWLLPCLTYYYTGRLTMQANSSIHANKNWYKFISMWVFPPRLHMEMLFWCVTGQGKISIPNPTTFHHWDPSSASTFGSHNTEVWLKSMGRGQFPVFGLEILAEARLLSNLWAHLCVGRGVQAWAGTGRPQEGGQDIPLCLFPLCAGDHISEQLQQELSGSVSLHRNLPQKPTYEYLNKRH